MPAGGDDLDAGRRAARAGLRDGAERAGARSHFRSMGIDPARLTGPIVGIGSTWTGTMPCNLTHRELAAAVAVGVEQAAHRPDADRAERAGDQDAPGFRHDAER